MCKIKKYIILLPLIILALFPPTELRIPLTSSELWIWAIFISGFLGLYTIFLKINPFVKIFSVYTFISCFFSAGPYVSFTAYIALLICIYYYIFCLKWADWEIVKRVLITIFILNVIMLLMQYIGKDYLCNFGLGKQENTLYGTLGNAMRLSSFMILITGFLMSFLKPDKYAKQKYILCIGIVVYVIIQQFVRRNVLHYFPLIRGDVWRETIRLANDTTTAWYRPLFGWGMGQFKIIFPALAKIRIEAQCEGMWLQAHNCWLQALFEIGRIGFVVIVSYTINLFYRLIKSRLFFCVIGLFFISLNILYHSPTRECQNALIIACYLAYLETRIMEAKCQLLQK